MASNSTLHNAKETINDEYYTLLSEIEKEMSHYKEQLKNKVIFCNCDDPVESNFYKYFDLNFDHLLLKGLISTHFDKTKPTYKLEIIRDSSGKKLPPKKTPLKQNGDFRSSECIELLKKSDIVVTNPPFSLFREFVAQLLEYNKKFIIIGRPDACNYKGFFPLLKEGKIWIGFKPFSKDMLFTCPPEAEKYIRENKKQGSGYKIIDGKFYARAAACWYSNIKTLQGKEKITLYKKYYGNEKEYPKIDNYNAIYVDKLSEIPCDYSGVMGVPITILDHYNEEQFEIVGITLGREEFDKEGNPTKRYEKPIQHSPNGKISNGSKTNTGMALLLKEKPADGVYYTADNVDGYLIMKYPRILVKRKDLEEFYLANA